MADRRRTSDVADEEESELPAEGAPEVTDEDASDAADADGRRSTGRVRRHPARRDRRPARRNQSGLTARAAAEAALRQLAELTTKQVEGITGVERTEDGWVVGIEVVEDRRIPSSTDILATYEAVIDPDGELLSYRRASRYPRGRGDDSRES
jgi:hypothetical protein